MSQPSNSAVRGSPTSSAASAPPPAAATGDFVVNLCASTTPMALAKPSAPELARYTFFVSRRREEGRERFRLHMGYFATREDAQQMLLLVRDLYPAAWVGETPGRKLAASPAAAAGATSRSSTPVAPATVSGRSTSPAAPPVKPASKAAPPVAPAPAPVVASAAPAAAAATVSVAAAPAPVPAAPATPTVRVHVPAPAAAPAAALSKAPAPAPAPAPAAAPAIAPASTTPPRARVVVPAVPAEPRAAAAASRSAVPPVSNVREVIAALEPDAVEPVVAPRAPPRTASPAVPLSVPAPAPAPASAPTAASPRSAVPPRAPAPAAPATTAPRKPPSVAAPAAPATAAVAAPVAAAAPGPVPAVRSTSPGADMTDSQVLRVLEGPSAAAQGRAAAAAGTPEARDIALLSPQDTQSWRDIKAQIKRDAVVHFAVQLSWAVTPIDLGRVPSLAIFNAYTLYKIEGNRDGRKWYGLRLGFFSDAVSAKQVAHYVRSEFAQVAVVPVGINEREQAKQIGAIALPAAGPAPRSAPQDDQEFKLIDDDAAPPPASATAAFDDVPPVVDLPPAATRAPESTNRRSNRPRGAPQSLEETLEILGASQLSIDSGRGERVVLDGRPRASDSSPSTFAKLLDRLGEKLRK
jgi:hypothetical protein